MLSETSPVPWQTTQNTEAPFCFQALRHKFARLFEMSSLLGPPSFLSTTDALKTLFGVAALSCHSAKKPWQQAQTIPIAASL